MRFIPFRKVHVLCEWSVCFWCVVDRFDRVRIIALWATLLCCVTTHQGDWNGNLIESISFRGGEDLWWSFARVCARRDKDASRG